MKKKAITILEIIIAAVVMAVTMIPIFALLSRQTVETDKNASQAFAINKATEILNTLLDNVSFATIRAGNPGYISVDDFRNDVKEKYSELTDSWAKKIASMLFNSNEKESGGYPCRGIITDSKGINYLVYLKVEDVISSDTEVEKLKIGEEFPQKAPNDFLDKPDVNFAYLKNPSILSYGGWCEDYAEDLDYKGGKPFTELEIGNEGVSEPKQKGDFYDDIAIDKLTSTKNTKKKETFRKPTAQRVSARKVMSKVPYKTDESQAYCPFKKLIVQIQWNVDPKYYSDPENTKGTIQRVHLMAIKGDID